MRWTGVLVSGAEADPEMQARLAAFRQGLERLGRRSESACMATGWATLNEGLCRSGWSCCPANVTGLSPPLRDQAEGAESAAREQGFQSHAPAGTAACVGAAADQYR